MSSKIRRMLRWIVRGVPERKVYVNVTQVNYDGLFVGKTALVTGGGSGIGEAIAKKFYQEGAKVLVIGRNEEKLVHVCSEQQGGAGELLYQAFDLTDFKHLEINLAHAKELLGGHINILINNAGIWKNKKLPDTDYSNWEQMFDVNLKAPYFVTKYLIGTMSEGDSVIVTGSENAMLNCTNPYTLTKVALHRFVGGIAKEYMDRGIRANAIAPGPTISEINHTDIADGVQRGDAYRVFLPEEMAEIACFLASPAARCINGQVIFCDEGESLR